MINFGYPGGVSTDNMKWRTLTYKYYTKEKLDDVIKHNLNNLQLLLSECVSLGIGLVRIPSSIIPLASHPSLLGQHDWVNKFQVELSNLGMFIEQNNLFTPMHPDHVVVLNSPSESVVQRSIQELLYHSELMDSLNLPTSVKYQIHVGGAYGDKNKAIQDFIKNYQILPQRVKDRLVLENDDHIFTLLDCFEIYKGTGIPLVLDTLHNRLNGNLDLSESIDLVGSTWEDSIMIDYSEQDKTIGARRGKHGYTFDEQELQQFISVLLSKNRNFNVTLELQDKQEGALKANKTLNELI